MAGTMPYKMDCNFWVFHPYNVEIYMVDPTHGHFADFSVSF